MTNEEFLDYLEAHPEVEWTDDIRACLHDIAGFGLWSEVPNTEKPYVVKFIRRQAVQLVIQKLST